MTKQEAKSELRSRRKLYEELLAESGYGRSVTDSGEKRELRRWANAEAFGTFEEHAALLAAAGESF